MVGVDLDVSAVRFANENYLSERVSFRRGDALALPIADCSIDVVVSFETIEHLEAHETFLAEVRRVLRPGGLLVISSPDRRVYTEEAGQKNPFHVRELGRGEFLRLLRGHFAEVALLEQRAMAGSVIMRAPETDSEGGIEGFSTADGTLFERADCIPECPYLVAVASDAALPTVPHSVMYSPRQIWLLEEMRQRAERRADEASAELARLSEELTRTAAERDLRGNEVDRRGAEIARLSEELTRTAAELSEKLTRTTAERDGLGAEVARLSEELTQTAAERDLRGNEVDRLSEELTQTAAERDLRGNEVDRRGAEIARLVEDLALVRRLAEEAEFRAQDVDAALRTILQSTTWRSTEQLRDVLARWPSIAKLGRRSLRLTKWTLSGRLGEGFRHWNRRRAEWRDAGELVRGGGINSAWYLENNPDVRAAGVDPAWHYVVHGRAEGRSPHPPLTAEVNFLPTASTEVEPSAAAPLAVTPASAPPPPDGRHEWATYGIMTRRIAEDRARQLAGLRPMPALRIKIVRADLAAVATGLVFPHVAEPLVSIIVPVFNNLRLTLECLLSIQRHTDAEETPYEVILADDASTDGSAEVLPRVGNAVYVRNDVNLGFLRNCNGATRTSRGEFVLFLNNDVQVTEGWLAPLVSAFRANCKMGAAGPRIVYRTAASRRPGCCSTRTAVVS